VNLVAAAIARVSPLPRRLLSAQTWLPVVRSSIHLPAELAAAAAAEAAVVVVAERRRSQQHLLAAAGAIANLNRK
jgi:hypothetical protein